MANDVSIFSCRAGSPNPAAKAFRPAFRGGVQRPRPTFILSDEAFTLIELLTVIAVIGILTAIIVPTVAGARNAANKARTRTQFAQWGAAFDQFKLEYGSYPQLFPNAAQKLVNQGATTQLTGNHLFHDILAGVRRDGQPLTGTTTGTPTPAIGQNTRRIRFMSFADSDFVLAGDVSAGRNTAQELNLIRDGFYNTQIAVVTDSNLDGVINGRDSAGGFPPVRIGGGTTTIRPTTIVTTGTTGGTHAGVIFYCAPPGSSSENDLLTSWK